MCQIAPGGSRGFLRADTFQTLDLMGLSHFIVGFFGAAFDDLRLLTPYAVLVLRFR